MSISTENTEIALLLAAIDTAASPGERGDRVATLAARKPDWRALDRLAARQGLALQLYRALSAEPVASAVGVEALAILRPRYLAQAFRCAQLAGELVRVTAMFRGAGIGMLAVKGPVLAMLAYGDLTMRQYGDIDLLVRPAEVTRAAELLVSAGYQPRTYDRAAFESGFFRNTADEFIKLNGFGVIDMHWRLGDWYFPFGPDEDAIWLRPGAVNVGGTDVPTLAAADHLLFLCVHASKHGWADLASVADVAWLLRAQPALDVPALIDEAARRGCRRMLLVGLHLARMLARAPLGNGVIRAIEHDPDSLALAERLAARIFASQAAGAFSSWMTALATIEHRRDRLRFVANLAMMPTSGDWKMLRLPRALFPFYYLLRPLRLLLKAPSLLMGSRTAGDR